jgi:hypothetical protein
VEGVLRGVASYSGVGHCDKVLALDESNGGGWNRAKTNHR